MQESMFERPPYRRRRMRQIEREREPNGLRAVSTFSGCGGSTLGLWSAGWDVRAALEFVPTAAASYRSNWPECPVLVRDIRETAGAELLRAAGGIRQGELDLLEGSPPCASYASGGWRYRGWGESRVYSSTKQRTDDLFDEWVRLIAEMQPRAALAENVSGLMEGESLGEADRIIRAIEAVGYRVGIFPVDAVWFGVPQRRRRVVIVAYRRDLGIIPEPPTVPDTEVWTLADALADVDTGSREHEVDAAEQSMRRYAVGLTWEAHRGLRPWGSCGTCNEMMLLATHRPDGEGGWVCSDGRAALRTRRYPSFYLPRLDRPCQTLTTKAAVPSAASVAHPTENRKMTPGEMLSIGGFPPDYLLEGTVEQRCERVTRSVPPPMYESIGRDIAAALKGTGR